jgi:hypothetical protein
VAEDVGHLFMYLLVLLLRNVCSEHRESKAKRPLGFALEGNKGHGN